MQLAYSYGALRQCMLHACECGRMHTNTRRACGCRPAGALTDQLQLLASLRPLQLVVSGDAAACQRALGAVLSLIKLKVRTAHAGAHSA